MPLSRQELDALAKLPYQRTWHPDYDEAGGVPAINEVKFSIAANRGCFGECAFCALAFHQGRIVQSRSTQSVVEEARQLTKLPDFKGYIHDIGGPTANFTRPACENQLKHGACAGKRCLAPKPCKNLVVDHSAYIRTLRAVRELPGIKKVFVRSGVRFDYIMLDKSDAFLRELCGHHVSGQLKVAPEHVSRGVLSLMGKPDCAVFSGFKAKYEGMNKNLGMEQYLVPYFISGHPGSALKDAVALAQYMRANRIRPEQVQDFYPPPCTLSTCMYYTGIDPLTMKSVYVPRDYEEKRMQRALLQYHRKENHALVRKALSLCGRADLIGFGGKCLVPPERADARGPDKPFNKTNPNRLHASQPTGTRQKIRGRSTLREERAMEKPEIRLTESGAEKPVPYSEGETVFEAMRRAGILVDAPCGGRGAAASAPCGLRELRPYRRRTGLCLRNPAGFGYRLCLPPESPTGHARFQCFPGGQHPDGFAGP
jgi:hypothetical protein